jgi:hypothetical protein
MVGRRSGDSTHIHPINNIRVLLILIERSIDFVRRSIALSAADQQLHRDTI